MPRSRQRNDKKQGVLLRPPNESDRILQLVQEMGGQFQREMEESDFQRWLRDLARFPIAAIEFAFEKWHENGRFFPQPADIRDLCNAWTPNIPVYMDGCNALCKLRHGKGYGTADVLWLYGQYMKKRKGSALNEPEIEILLDMLDKHRKHAPAWRL
jgi:hypothetical protein